MTLLLDRVLVLTVTVAIGSGILFCVTVLLFVRVSAIEQRITENSKNLAANIVRRLGERISDIDLPAAQVVHVAPLSTRTPPRSRRGS